MSNNNYTNNHSDNNNNNNVGNINSNYGLVRQLPLVSESTLANINSINNNNNSDIHNSYDNYNNNVNGINTNEIAKKRLTIVELLSKRGLRLELETPQSINKLYKESYLPDHRFCSNTHVGKDIELLIKEAYCDDLYDNTMHAATVRNINNNEALGIIYWRDLTENEMKKWMKFEFIQQALIQENQRTLQEKQYLLQIAHKNDQKSLTNNTNSNTADANSIADELQGIHINDNSDNNNNNNNSMNDSNHLIPLDSDDKSIISSSTLNQSNIGRDWIKIELLAVLPNTTGQRIGSILLTAALVYASQHRKHHSILHVAGGSSNIPAVKLYQKFGFQSVPPVYFNQPNKDMFILLDIQRVLRNMDWRKLLMKKQHKAIEHHNNNTSNNNTNNSHDMDSDSDNDHDHNTSNPSLMRSDSDSTVVITDITHEG